MRPLDPIEGTSSIKRLLASAPPGEVRREIARLGAIAGGAREAAAIAHAEGALALREGALDEALEALDRASRAFLAAGEIDRLRASVVVGLPMPPSAIYSYPLTSLESLSAWIVNGARTPVCP